MAKAKAKVVTIGMAAGTTIKLQEAEQMQQVVGNTTLLRHYCSCLFSLARLLCHRTTQIFFSADIVR
jgi:hypothetical protein